MSNCDPILILFFPKCQVRVARFNVSCLLLPRPPPPPLLLSSSPRPPGPPCHLLVLVVLVVLAQLPPRDPQCSLPDLNHDRPCPVIPAGPQPRQATPIVPCWTSTTTIHAQFVGPQPRVSTPSDPSWTSCRKYGTKNFQKKGMSERNVRRYMPEDMPDRMPHWMQDKMPEDNVKIFARRYAR